MSIDPLTILSQLAQQQGVLRARDLKAAGISRRQFEACVKSGAIRREARGLYSISGFDITEKHSLVLASLRVPSGVICLLSALVFHGLTTQNPSEVWMAIENKARKPKFKNPKLRIVRFSGEALREGVEEHVVEGVTVRVYSIAKAIADLFKYRHKVGIDIAIEALREAVLKKRTTRDAIMRSGKVCRVENVIRPYMESV